MLIKSKHIPFAIYFSLNFIFYIYWFKLGEVGGDFSGVKINSYTTYLFVGGVELFLMLIFYFLLIVILKGMSGRGFNQIKRNSYFPFFVLILQVFYFIYSYKTGIGRLSGEFDSTYNPGYFKFIFTIFNPDLFTLIYFFIYSVRRREASQADFKFSLNFMILLNVFVYIVSGLYRGWIAGVLLNLFVVFITSRFNFVKIKYIVVVFVFSMILIPSVYYAKYVSRDAEEFSVSKYSEYYSKELYPLILERALSRFQHISETYVLSEHKDKVKDSYDKGDFVPFIFDNSMRRILSGVFGLEYKTIGEFSADNILKRESGGNIHVGIFTWLNIGFFVAVFYFFVFLINTFFSFILLSRITSKNNAFVIVSWLWILFFMHGWFSSVSISTITIFFIVIFHSFRVKFANE